MKKEHAPINQADSLILQQITQAHYNKTPLSGADGKPTPIVKNIKQKEILVENI